MRWAASVVLAVLTLGTPAAAAVLDGLVAKVDGAVITWSEVLQEAALLRLEGRQDAYGGPRVLEALVRRKLFAAAAEKLRLEAGPKEIDAELAAEARAAGVPVSSWTGERSLGLRAEDLQARARELVLTRRYRELQRETIYVTESELQSYLSRKPQSAATRDQARTLLEEKKFDAEMEAWVRQQFASGRVRLLPIPGGNGEPSPEGARGETRP